MSELTIIEENIRSITKGKYHIVHISLIEAYLIISFIDNNELKIDLKEIILESEINEDQLSLAVTRILELISMRSEQVSVPVKNFPDYYTSVYHELRTLLGDESLGYLDEFNQLQVTYKKNNKRFYINIKLEYDIYQEIVKSGSSNSELVAFKASLSLIVNRINAMFIV